jgi:hypothetical protein
MIGSPDRVTHMNSASPAYPTMARPIFGFRPESAWPGALFQVFLQGPFVPAWQKQKELEYWIVFNSQDMPATFFEIESHVSMPDIGYKRYVVQCVIPEDTSMEGQRCSVALKIRGPGGRSIAQGLFVGFFEYRPNGILHVVFFANRRWNLENL